jgi:hypothetical protein
VWSHRNISCPSDARRQDLHRSHLRRSQKPTPTTLNPDHMEPDLLSTEPWTIPVWLYFVLAAALAGFYSYIFPKLQEWMSNRKG